jgi:iron(III) transport system substrate-binding protein
MSLLRVSILFIVALSFPLGCRSAKSRVVLYCAHDREFVEEILKDFTKESGLEVVPRYDSEANKSVSLVEDLIREAKRPRCDVHWNNEILGTIRLQRHGVLEAYQSPAAEAFTKEWKADDHTWTAFAARARVLILNTEKVPDPNDWPKSFTDLLDPRWRGRVAMAKPQFGTTATQAACLFQAWGSDRAKAFYSKLHEQGVNIVPGNKQVAVGVGRGQFDIGMTDTDDAMAEIDAGRLVAMIFPDADASQNSGRGTLFIPNTIAVIKGGPNPEGAKKLVDFLLSPQIEKKLAESPSRQIPLNPKVKAALAKEIRTPQTARALPVDFAKAADLWTEAQTFLVKEFARR